MIRGEVGNEYPGTALANPRKVRVASTSLPCFILPLTALLILDAIHLTKNSYVFYADK